MQQTSMRVHIHTPDGLLYDGVAEHVYAIAENGALGLQPNHCDFVTALQPAVLIVRDPRQKELFFAIDEGLLVKQDQRIEVAVRRGVQGENLEELNQLLLSTFGELDERERQARSALSKLEASVVRRFAELAQPL